MYCRRRRPDHAHVRDRDQHAVGARGPGAGGRGGLHHLLIHRPPPSLTRGRQAPFRRHRRRTCRRVSLPQRDEVPVRRLRARARRQGVGAARPPDYLHQVGARHLFPDHREERRNGNNYGAALRSGDHAVGQHRALVGPALVVLGAVVPPSRWRKARRNGIAWRCPTVPRWPARACGDRAIVVRPGFAVFSSAALALRAWPRRCRAVR